MAKLETASSILSHIVAILSLLETEGLKITLVFRILRSPTWTK
jgi:hypothetical protein